MLTNCRSRLPLHCWLLNTATLLSYLSAQCDRFFRMTFVSYHFHFYSRQNCKSILLCLVGRLRFMISRYDKCGIFVADCLIDDKCLVCILYVCVHEWNFERRQIKMIGYRQKIRILFLIAWRCLLFVLYLDVNRLPMTNMDLPTYINVYRHPKPYKNLHNLCLTIISWNILICLFPDYGEAKEMGNIFGSLCMYVQPQRLNH